MAIQQHLTVDELQLPNGDALSFYGKVYYGRCTSSSTDSDKEIQTNLYLDTMDNANVPIKGTILMVYFQYESGNSGNIRLKLNGLSGRSVYTADSNYNVTWAAESYVVFIFDGYRWIKIDPNISDWAKQATKPTYTASEVGALPDTTVIPEDKVFIATYNSTTYADTLEAYNAGKLIFAVYSDPSYGKLIIPLTRKDSNYFQFEGKYLQGRSSKDTLTLASSGWTHNWYTGDMVTRSATISSGDGLIIRDVDDNHVMKYSSISFGTDATQYLANDGTWQSVPTVPTKTSDLTNDSGYLTSSDIASVMTYKGTKANYASLPSSDNTIGDVWHLTDTGAEWAWDGSAWQELGTAIDLSNYATKSTTLSGYGITDAKIQNGTITLGSNTITPLTSYTETDPTVPAWAKQATKPTYTASEVGALAKEKTNSEGDTFDINLSGNGTTTAGLFASFMYNNGQNVITPLSIVGNGSTGKVETTISGVVTPTYDDNAANKKYVDDSIGAISIPTKTSDLTNDSGYLTSYTETDPVFNASPAAGITSTDISNWNGKVSDDKTWNGVTLQNGTSLGNSTNFVPCKSNSTTGSGNMYFLPISATPTANYGVKYNSNAYLISTTPSANDNSTKVATTAYVDAAIPDVSNYVNKTGDTINGNLTFTDGKAIIMTSAANTALNTPERFINFRVTGQDGSDDTAYTHLKFFVNPSSQEQTVHISGIHTPSSNGSDFDTYVASKKYVDDSIPKVYSSSNTNGYLTMATLPIYDGSVTG